MNNFSPQEITLPGKVSNQYLERQQARESNARTYPRRIPIAIREANGIYVKDVDGNLYFSICEIFQAAVKAAEAKLAGSELGEMCGC